MTLDLCHISHLAERWFAVRYFREAETCDDMDVAFLPYELVVLVTLSLHQPNSRRIGFSVAERGLLRTSEPVDPAPGVDHPGGQ